MRFPRRRFAARPARAPQLTKTPPSPSPLAPRPAPVPPNAGNLTELQQLTAATPDARAAFLAALSGPLRAMVKPQTPTNPLLIHFNAGLQLHVKELRNVLARFVGTIETGAQNSAAGALPPPAPPPAPRRLLESS